MRHRAFSHKEANDARLPVEQLRKHDSEGFFYRIGDRRFEDGYLFRSYNVRNLSLEEGVPPLEELQRFNQVGTLSLGAARCGAGLYPFQNTVMAADMGQ